jgi:RNA polymerase sigma factor (sigma-70 family)
LSKAPLHNESKASGGAVFRTTQWTVVLTAGSGDTPEAAAALEHLCARYWYPLYAYIRRRGSSHADAADLTQAFFERLLERNFLDGLSRGVGRFRSFLLTALKNFLVNEWESGKCIKRGGGRKIISLNDSTADELYLKEPADDASPDKLFEKRWALSVIEHVLKRLHIEFVASEKAELFEVLKPTLTAEKLDQSYAEIAAAFGLSEGALKVTIHRMRKRFGQLLREEIAETVQDSSEVDDEMRHLIEALG